eukprot:COSAG05_NODE_1514_length_4665_cov_54.657687_6_plen_413_part_00
MARGGRPAGVLWLLCLAASTLLLLRQAGTEAEADNALLTINGSTGSTVVPASNIAAASQPAFNVEFSSTRKCRQKVPPTVVVVDSPPTFSFPAYGRTVCYQPTTQVLQQLGWRHTPEARLQSTLVSRLSNPDRTLRGRGGGYAPFRLGKSYTDRLPNYTAIGGSKLQQHQVKQEWTGRHGCDVSETGLYPEQYFLTDPLQCRAFWRLHGEHSGSTWLLKQASGLYKNLHAAHGITLIHNATSLFDLRQRFPCGSGAGSNAADRGNSEQRQQFIIQAEVPPLLLMGRKFDFRAFFLVARTEPLFAFAHDGFLRLAPVVYNSSRDHDKLWRSIISNAEFGDGLTSISHDEHYWSMEQLQTYLSATNRAPPHFVEDKVRKFVHRAMVFALLAGKKDLGTVPGTFQLFAFDFMVSI